MILEEAVHKAVNDGYYRQHGDGLRAADSGVHGHRAVSPPCGPRTSLTEHVGETLLDPTFWQALASRLEAEGRYPHGDWKILWHDFIEHLIDGGSAEGFFAPLTAPRKERDQG